MIVMTGGRGSRSSSASSNVGLGVGVLGRRDDLDLLVELVGEHLDRVVGQRLRERRHLAEAHQLLDDLRHADAEVLRDVLDRRAGVDADDVGLQRGDVLRDGLLVGAAPAPAAATPRRAVRGTATGAAAGTAAGTATGPLAARGLRVDDDAADAAGRTRGALALQRGARGPALSRPPPLAPSGPARASAWPWASAGSSGRGSPRAGRGRCRGRSRRAAGGPAARRPSWRRRWRPPWAWACRSTRRRRASRPRRLRRPSPRGRTRSGA